MRICKLKAWLRSETGRQGEECLPLNLFFPCVRLFLFYGNRNLGAWSLLGPLSSEPWIGPLLLGRVREGLRCAASLWGRLPLVYLNAKNLLWKKRPMLKHFLYTRTFFFIWIILKSDCVCCSYILGSSNPGKNPKLVPYPLRSSIWEEKILLLGDFTTPPSVPWKSPIAECLFKEEKRSSFLFLTSQEEIRFLPFLSEVPLLFKVFLHLFRIKK